MKSLSLSFGLLLVLVAPSAGVSAAEPTQGAPDPFAESNRDPRSQGTAAKEVLVQFKATAEPARGAPGSVFKLTITGKVQPGYHTFPLTVRTDNERFNVVSALTYGQSEGLEPLWPIRETLPRLHKDRDPNIGSYLVHEGEFTWTQDVLVSPDAKPGPHTLKLNIKFQACDERRCVQDTQSLDVPVEVTAEPAVTVGAELQQRRQMPRPAVEVLPLGGARSATPEQRTPSGGTRAQPAGSQAKVTPADRPGDLSTLLLTSVFAAIAMLFTPCVFPMIPITVSFFLKQSEKKHHNAPLTAAVYSLTIILVLALAVVVLGQLIVVWANSIWLNFALAALLVIFALSLFGMYDIELPSFLTRWTSSGEGRGGYLGAVFMALTFTITSFTCTGPFLGPLLVATSQMQNINFFSRFLAALAYAATFAAPFFVLALFPGLLKRLPKSGGWLNAVKVVMGFLELAAALKFLGNVDLTLNPGNPWFFTYDTVLVSWIALSIACGLYLLGLIRLPHDTPQDHIGVPRMVLATIFFGLAIYMTPALWRETPTGIIGRGLVGFLPLDTKAKPDVSVGAPGGSVRSEHFMDYQKAWETAKKENKLLFIDFTGVQCVNCISNERNVFPLPAVRSELDKYVVVKIYTDVVPNPSLSAGEAHAQAEYNKKLQGNTFGDTSLPLYVILDPDKDTAIKDDRILGQVLGTYAGYIADPNAFLELLRKPLQERAAP